MNYVYKIDSDELTVKLDEGARYEIGAEEILSQRFGDLTETKDWFKEGFSIEKSSRFYDLKKLYSATENAIKNIIENLDLNTQLDGFTLEKYHEYVGNELHAEVVQKTKRLFPDDLNIDTQKIVEEFGKYFGTKLTFSDPITGQEQWMIARINRPRSNDYNTVHKDIYESFDEYSDIPRMVNIWIPLSGVTESNSLPIASKSHLLSEDLIVRSKAGSKMNGIPYSVASIKSWDGRSMLSRAILDADDVLIFSSHLIHGLAVNNSDDITRISFEFRLYEDS